MRLHSRIAWFLIAGLIGFGVDAGILSLLIGLGMDARLARVASVSVALVLTWLINRRFAFGDRVGPPSLAEFLRYLLASSAAALINIGVFFALLTWGHLVPRGELFTSYPLLAAVVATGISMSFNFWNYFTIVFKRRPKPNNRPDV